MFICIVGLLGCVVSLYVMIIELDKRVLKLEEDSKAQIKPQPKPETPGKE